MGVTQYSASAVGSSGGGAVKSGDRIDPAHEGRRGDHLEVVARAEADNPMVADELRDAFQVRADPLEKKRIS